MKKKKMESDILRDLEVLISMPSISNFQRELMRRSIREIELLREEVERYKTVATNAQCNAKILAHAFVNDTRPPTLTVEESLMYPTRTRSNDSR